MIQHNDSNIEIKNVAVCMYGQYRTGDSCLEYIKKFYEAEGCNVDFFCSLKPYETSYTRHKYNSMLDKRMEDKDVKDVDTIKHQVSQITNILAPTKFKLYTLEYENQLKNINGSLVQSKVLSAWVDSIFLKNAHEADTGINYDLVVMQRYDAIVWPSFAFRSIVDRLHGTSTSRRDTFQTSDKNILMTNPIEFIRKHPGLLMYPNGQDMWALGVGTALDTIAYEFLNNIPSKTSSQFDKKKFYDGVPYYDTHEMLGTTATRFNIPRFPLPTLTQKKQVKLPYQMAFDMGPNNKYFSPAVFPIRDVFFENNILPNLVEWSDDEIEILYDDSLAKWMTGE